MTVGSCQQRPLLVCNQVLSGGAPVRSVQVLETSMRGIYSASLCKLRVRSAGHEPKGRPRLHPRNDGCHLCCQTSCVITDAVIAVFHCSESSGDPTIPRFDSRGWVDMIPFNKVRRHWNGDTCICRAGSNPEWQVLTTAIFRSGQVTKLTSSDFPSMQYTNNRLRRRPKLGVPTSDNSIFKAKFIVACGCSHSNSSRTPPPNPRPYPTYTPSSNDDSFTSYDMSRVLSTSKIYRDDRRHRA